MFRTSSSSKTVLFIPYRGQDTILTLLVVAYLLTN